ncbi:hypothetical protein Slala05_73260 [Streptomyces lavendulae subsp. lavendulae]|nr:hypothetical protein Slala05_73260 [Streptomyces lavendulae subsp. lavendulae]
MPTQANAVPPSLVNELAELKRRMSAIERAPAPVTRFDRYPVIEWAAQGRPDVGGNVWSSVGIANVTGMTFDRIETKFITDHMLTGKREAEVRLAAYRHNGNSRTCVSASSVLNITGTPTRGIGVVVLRWIHGIPYGWDYSDSTTIYTIELQHRYKVGPEPFVSNREQIFGMYKREKDRGADGGGGVDVGGGNWVAYQSGNNRSAIGYVTIPDGADESGAYGISAMHYCVGLPKERLPQATAKGTGTWWNTGASWGRDPDVTEDDFGV